MSTLRNIKDQFPIFSKRPELVYLDNAATSQKPSNVIETMKHFYSDDNANVHRGLYDLSTTATHRYEEVRSKVATMIGATAAKQVTFTKGTTESINIIALGFLRKQLKAGDQVVVSAMEHHANIIPWQQACQQQGANLAVLPVDQNGDLEIGKLDSLLSSKTKMVALTHISNVLGTINPVDEIIDRAQKKKIPVLLDAAQSAGHYLINVAKLDVEFLAFSAHKMFGPLGTGVLYCKPEHADDIDPIHFGGGAIKTVTFDETQFLDYPHRLEAGTPNIAGVLGLGAAIDFIEKIDYKEAREHTEGLANLFREKLATIKGFHPVGNPKRHGPIVSFVSKTIHPHDIASFLSQANVAIRAGHHCAQPLMDALKIPATARVSFSIYNTTDDVDKVIRALIELEKFWS
jgi:cysteine desulfurase/selenocysteine lyase